MNKTPYKKLDKRQKKLERTKVTVSLAPNSPVRNISAMQALHAATKYRDENKYESAQYICLQLLGHNYASIDASIIMLEMAVDLQRPAETNEFCERLLKVSPKQLHAAVALAKAFRTLNKHDAALNVIERALKANPSSCALRHMLATYLIEVNEIDRAKTELRTIIRIDSKFMPAYQQLAALDALTEDEIAWLEQVEFNGDDRISTLTSLATVYRRKKNADKEINYLNLAQAELANKTNWQSVDFSDEAQATIDTFNTNFFSKHRQNTENRRQPIFIVGMPRSGSTLTEQILETNKDVEAIGESTLLQCIVQDFCKSKFSGTPFLESATRFEDDDIAQIATDYSNQVSRIYTQAPIFIDKQLNSYMYLGILHLAFPYAKFIHTLRNPLDNCLSCYQQVFDRMEASRSLESLAKMYKAHLNLMDHWKNLLSDRIFTARYEDMISNPRHQSQALFDFCGIPWNEDFLNFYANKTAIKTASLMQVRQPIYSTSVEKWRRYESHLEPVMRVLGLEPNCAGADG